VLAGLTSSRAILLDGLFDVTCFIAALFTLKVPRVIHREDDDRFPYGYVCSSRGSMV
jgi:predicted Co/Zn/Cd cation transporter (cation efflux family)